MDQSRTGLLPFVAFYFSRGIAYAVVATHSELFAVPCFVVVYRSATIWSHNILLMRLSQAQRRTLLRRNSTSRLKTFSYILTIHFRLLLLHATTRKPHHSSSFRYVCGKNDRPENCARLLGNCTLLHAVDLYAPFVLRAVQSLLFYHCEFRAQRKQNEHVTEHTLTPFIYLLFVL